MACMSSLGGGHLPTCRVKDMVSVAVLARNLDIECRGNWYLNNPEVSSEK